MSLILLFATFSQTDEHPQAVIFPLCYPGEGGGVNLEVVRGPGRPMHYHVNCLREPRGGSNVFPCKFSFVNSEESQSRSLAEGQRGACINFEISSTCVFFYILRGEQSFTAAGLAPKRTIQTAAELEADRQGTTG